MLRVPVQIARDRARIGKELRRISRATSANPFRDAMSRDATTTLNHFAHGVAAASADIPRVKLAALQRADRLDVRINEILDMNVITNARAIVRGVVGSKDHY